MSGRAKRLSIVVLAVAILVSLMATTEGYAKKPQPPSREGLTDLEYLGKLLYFDQSLSTPDGQACADCHLPVAGFDDPDADMPVSQGVLPRNRWGNRNSPAASYAMYAPTFQSIEGLWFGGQFWDGRATGAGLGDPLADQALGPFLNPLEMNNPNERAVVNEVRKASYVKLFKAVWGNNALDSVDAAYDWIALSIAAYERSWECARFNSRYDDYLRVCLTAGMDKDLCAQGAGLKAELDPTGVLTDQEWYGMQLFMGENDNDGTLTEGEGAFCNACHVAEWVDPAGYANPIHVPQWAKDLGVEMAPPVFSDYSFDNAGVPRNPDNPFYTLPPAFNPDGADWIDAGLGGVLGDQAEWGKFKVMSLRNIGVTAPYLHNGLFDSLADVVSFYNTRDVDPGWASPEYAPTVNFDELGDLGLSTEDEAALVAFMLTLTDGNLVGEHTEP